jgi:hypothetical protein
MTTSLAVLTQLSADMSQFIIYLGAERNACIPVTVHFAGRLINSNQVRMCLFTNEQTPRATAPDNQVLWMM